MPDPSLWLPALLSGSFVAFIAFGLPRIFDWPNRHDSDSASFRKDVLEENEKCRQRVDGLESQVAELREQLWRKNHVELERDEALRKLSAAEQEVIALQNIIDRRGPQAP